MLSLLPVFVFRFYLFISRERKRQKERVRNTNVREKHPSVAFCKNPNRGWNP